MVIVIFSVIYALTEHSCFSQDSLNLKLECPSNDDAIIALTQLRLSCVAAALSEFRGCHAGVALEVAVEVLAALETESVGHLGDCDIG